MLLVCLRSLKARRLEAACKVPAARTGRAKATTVLYMCCIGLSMPFRAGRQSTWLLLRILSNQMTNRDPTRRCDHAPPRNGSTLSGSLLLGACWLRNLGAGDPGEGGVHDSGTNGHYYSV